MAKRRLQVDDLSAPEQLRAVATPVETYVRPPETQLQASDLSQFLTAITPAIKAEAQAKKEQALKLQREAERGVAAKRAADAKLGVGKALRAASQDFLDNQEEYMSLSEEEIASRRAEVMQPFVDMANQSGDQLLIDALNSDIEMGNLSFFAKVYDPTKRQYDFNMDMQSLTEELIAISDNEAMMGDPEIGATPTDRTLFKVNQIEETINQYQMASGYSFNEINDYVFENVIAPRVQSNGRDALYRWGEQKKLYNVGRYQKTVKTINNELRIRDERMLKQQDPIVFQQQILGGIDSYMTGISDGKVVSNAMLMIGQEITLPSGAKKTVSEDDVVSAFESYAQSENLSGAAIVDFYKRNGLVPRAAKDSINSGKFMLVNGEINEANLAQAERTMQAIMQMEASGLDIPSSLMSEEEMKRFRIAEVWSRDKGVDLGTALLKAQNIDTTIVPENKNKFRAKVINEVGTVFITDHGDTKNKTKNINAIVEDAMLFMQSGVESEEEAIKLAVEVFNQDHIVHTSSNGVTLSFQQRNTNPDVSLPVQQTLDSAATEIGGNVQIQNIIGKLYPTVENAGVALTNGVNPEIVNVNIIDEQGNWMGSLGTISKRQLLNDPNAVNNLIAANIQEAIDMGIDPNTGAPKTEDGEPKSIADIDDPFLSPDDLMMAQNVGTELPTKEEFRENMGDMMSIISEPLKDLGEAINPAIQSIQESVREVFAQEQLDVPDLVAETTTEVLPQLSQAVGGVGTFFKEEYDNTKRKLSNDKAIQEAQRILEDMPELIQELGLDVRGLLASGGKSVRGITQKEQAAIARTIIATQNAGERQYDVETSQDLTDALAKASITKGVSEQDILEKIIKPIAFHESDGTMNPNLKQYGDGPARGLMQFEPARFKTSVQRAKNYHKIVGQDLPEWIASIDTSGDNKAIQKTITELSANQQMALAVYDLLQHPTANISQVINGKQDITEFWLDNWWAGADRDRFDRSKAFRASMTKYSNQ